MAQILLLVPLLQAPQVTLPQPYATPLLPILLRILLQMLLPEIPPATPPTRPIRLKTAPK